MNNLDPLMSLLTEKVSRGSLRDIEAFLDKLFARFDIDIAFTRHFFDRLNDSRNGEEITGHELIDIFKKVHEKFGKEISLQPDDFQGVLVDLSDDLNIPFVINMDDNNGDLDLVAKTIMRKRNFRTSNRQFKVK